YTDSTIALPLRTPYCLSRVKRQVVERRTFFWARLSRSGSGYKNLQGCAEGRSPGIICVFPSAPMK
ncbi:MAG TPA: hypothetical protein VNM37_06015, partial [Candidatus Dormibacteraeota bacterium]|nr:hypothetical protein [Candidatus Dormibacteraeota bacterium]